MPKTRAEEIQTLKQMYAQYVEATMPPDAGDVQRQQTEYAFYAGAQFMFNTLTLDASGLPEEEAMKSFTAFAEELEAYVAKVREDLKEQL